LNSRKNPSKDYKTYLTDVKGTPQRINYKGGEEVLPKKYKTAMSLDGKSMSWLKTHPEYFEEIARRRFNLDPHISITGNEVGVASDLFDVVITNKKVADEECNL